MAEDRSTPDYAHSETDRLLEEVESRVSETYRKAAEEMSEKLNAWYAKFAAKDKQKAQLVKDGKLKMEDYIAWREGQMLTRRRLEVLTNRLTNDFVHADKLAMEIVNGNMADVFALNANYAAYTVENLTGQDIAWTLYDRDTVNRLLKDEPTLLPQPKVNEAVDTAWNQKHITNAVTQGILQGESIPNIAKRLQDVTAMDKRAAIRSARTATTGAECAGRVQSYKRAEQMGIRMQQEWLATLDNRTRHAHRMLDGQRVAVGKPFKIDGYEIEYPGDPSAPGYLVYNCRCTLVAAIEGMEDGNRIARDPDTGKWETIQNMTYQEWEAKKKAEMPDTWDAYMKKGKNLSSDKKQYREYRKILGNKMPKSLAEFQDLKYNYPEKWEYLKDFKKYVTRVPEATNADYEIYKKIKGIAKDGVVRVPADKIDISVLTFRDAHAARHGCTVEQGRHYVETALYSVTKERWDGVSVNYFSASGATYIDPDTMQIKTCYGKDNFDAPTKKIMEVIYGDGVLPSN